MVNVIQEKMVQRPLPNKAVVLQDGLKLGEGKEYTAKSK